MIAICATCSQDFTAIRSTARYCGDACRKRASRVDVPPEAGGRPVGASKDGGRAIHHPLVSVTSERPTAVQIAGPQLSASAFHCASLPLDHETARRANREAWASQDRIARSSAGRDFERRSNAVASEWRPTGDGACVPDIPDFLRRAV
jgi:hypothetical protein